MVICFVTVGCKTKTKETAKTTNTEIKAENVKETSFEISGMTCEVGCARTIASKLSKQEGVIEANVVFADSIAKVKFDKTKTNTAKLMAVVEGIGDDMYKTSITRPEGCKCEGCKGKIACSEKCKNKCNKKKKQDS